MHRSESPHIQNKDESQNYYAELKKEARPKIMHTKGNLQGSIRPESERGWTAKATRKLWGVIEMFSLLIMVMVSQVYTYVKTHQIECFKYE